MSLPLTQDEKIDYIYKHIKSEKRNRIFKIFFKIAIVVGLFYGTQYIINNVGPDKIKETISTQIGDITAPIVRDLVSDLDKDSVEGISRDKIQKLLKENPSLLDNFK